MEWNDAWNVDPDMKVHRYMNLAKFMDLIENRQIFFSRMDNFPDDLEGIGCDDYNMFWSGQHILLDQTVNCIMPKWGSVFKPLPAEKLKELDEKYELLQTKYDNFSIETLWGDIRTKGLGSEGILKSQRSWVDAFCLYSDDKSESYSMWKLYGSTEFSIRITCSLGALVRDMSESNKNLYVDSVYYANYQELDGIDPVNQNPIFLKSNAYKSENELRMVLYDKSMGKDFLEKKRDEKDFGTTVSLTDFNFLEEVKVSPEAPHWFFELVEKIVSRYGLENTKVSKSDIRLK